MSSKVNNPVPLLALRELVVFPQQVVPLFVGREKSVRAIEESQKENKYIMLAAQKDARTSNPGEKDIYEVTLNVTVTSTQDEQTAFLIELKQAGIFLIRDFPDEQRNQLLGSYCPHTLFPFAREAISDFASKGGFPPLLLSPVNFDALYAQQLAKAKSTAAETKH